MNRNFLKFVMLSIGAYMLKNINDTNKTQNQKIKGNIPSFKGVLEVRHTLDGRIRLYVPMIKNNLNLKKFILKEMGRIPAISSIEVNSITGTILIYYDKTTIKPMLLIGVVIKLLNLEEEVRKEPESKISKELKNIKDSLNYAVYNKSQGILDMKTIVILSLLICGLYKYKKYPYMAPGGITYLWWAYSSIK